MTHSKAALATCLVLLLSLGVGCHKKAQEPPKSPGPKPTGGAAKPAVTQPAPTTKAAKPSQTSGAANAPERNGERKLVSHSNGKRGEDGWVYDYGISEPEWSPDGKVIAFTKHLSRYVKEHKTWHGKSEVWIVSKDGQQIRRMARMARKLFWEPPSTLVYVYWTPGTGIPAMIAHFASVDIASGRRKELEKKPSIPTIKFQWNGKSYSILDTKTHFERMNDKGRHRFLKDFKGHVPVQQIDVRQDVIVFSGFWQTVDTKGTSNILHLQSGPVQQARVIVRNGSQPSLSPDRRDIAFIRDGDLWVRHLRSPLRPIVASGFQGPR